MRHHERFDPNLPTVLGAHVHVRGGQVSTLFRISEQEDVVFESADLPADFAYVALGHIHKPQQLEGQGHVRYSGSIERMDLGEANDNKGVVLVEIGPKGRNGDPLWLPLPATPLYRVEVRRPREQLPQLAMEYADADRALVYLDITYTAGQDNLEALLHDLEQIFPRWYAREWKESGALDDPMQIGAPSANKGFEETVRDYLSRELVNYSQAERDAILARAEALMRSEEE